MNSIGFIALVLVLFSETTPQNNPICKAKRYQCEVDPIPDGACVYIADAQEKYYFIRACSGEKSYCPYDNAKYGSPAMCEKPVVKTVQSALPFDACSKDEECLSLRCQSGKCKGRLVTETCKSHAECDAGLFCDITALCVQQMEFDQFCRSDEECVNNCVCNNKKCAFYYTFADGSEADNPKACESGYIVDGKCSAGLKTKNHGQPCTVDEDCQFIDSSGVVKKYGNCTCGFNAGTHIIDNRFVFLLQLGDW